MAGLKVNYQASQPPGAGGRPAIQYAYGRTDAAGRFAFEGLDQGTVNVFASGAGENRDWTYRAAQDVRLVPGATAEVTLELIRGVEVEGSVVAQETGMPVEGVQVVVYGPFRPRSTPMTTGVTTDAQGRYRYRLPSGETNFYVMGPPEGFTYASGGSNRTVTIPDGAATYEVPPLKVAAGEREFFKSLPMKAKAAGPPIEGAVVAVRGRVAVVGAPTIGATVVGLCEGGACRPFGGAEAVSDARGGFRLPPALGNVVAIGKPARLRVRHRDGAEHEAAAVPAADGAVALKLPVVGEGFKGVEGPRGVAPDELAGVVVDADGKPIEGAEVDAWTWYPGHEATTDAGGLSGSASSARGARSRSASASPATRRNSS